MANWSINVLQTDNGFTIGAVLRNPSTPASGGTSLLTNFKDTATDGGDGLGHVMRNPLEVIVRAAQMIQNDRSKNGD